MSSLINSWNVIGFFFMGFGHLQRIFPLVMIFLYWSGLRVYKIEGNTLTKFTRDIKWASMYEHDDEPMNWISGYFFLGYLEVRESRDECIRKAYVFCHSSLLKKYSQDSSKEESQETKTSKPITIYEREGAFWRIKYQKVNLVFRDINPRNCQKMAIDKILKHYNEKKYSTVLLYGVPGCGKSMLGILLAKHLLKTCPKVNFVDSFCPSDPGDEFISLYVKISPTEKSPMIVVLEEVDILVEKMHNGKVEEHKDLPVLVKNKTGWNMFFDKFDRERFPYVIFIMTSNQHIQWFNKLDPAYFRDGRVNLKIEMKK
jgi:hypothetical protein